MVLGIFILIDLADDCSLQIIPKKRYSHEGFHEPCTGIQWFARLWESIRNSWFPGCSGDLLVSGNGIKITGMTKRGTMTVPPLPLGLGSDADVVPVIAYRESMKRWGYSSERSGFLKTVFLKIIEFRYDSAIFTNESIRQDECRRPKTELPAADRHLTRQKNLSARGALKKT
jgi:hypothetical protein